MKQGIRLMPQRAHSQTGLSMIELMVAMAISLLLVTGLISLVGNTNQNFQELTRASQQLENGRYAWQLLRDELRLAGFYGELFAVPAAGASLPDPCAVSDVTTQYNGLAFPVQGYDSPSTSPVTCIADTAFAANTDVLVIRRASTKIGTKAGYLHIQSTPTDVKLDTLPTADEGGDTPSLDTVFTLTWGAWDDATAVNDPNSTTYDSSIDPNYRPPVRPFLDQIYFISPDNTDGDGVPTLKRVEVGAADTTTVSLVEGVENLQILYGIDNSPAPDGDGIPDTYVSAPSTTDDWNNVVALEFHLLVRNLEPTGDYTDDKTYNLGGTVVGPFSDNYKRHVYSAAVRLTNPAGRRE